MGECEDIRNKIQNSILHELLHVLVRLPLLGCFVQHN